MSRLNASISTFLRNGHMRTFSHLYRSARARRPLLTAPNTTTNLALSSSTCTAAAYSRSSLDVRHLISPASTRAYSSLYRRGHMHLYCRIASALSLDFLNPAMASPPARSPAVTPGRAIVGSRGFSHSFRQRKAALLKSCLPATDLPFVRTASTAATIGDPSTSARPTGILSPVQRKRLSLVLRALLAGATVYAALQFVQEQEATTLNDLTYVPFRVTNIEQVSPTTSIITLEGHIDSPLEPIASISIREPGSNVQRPYTVLDVSDKTPSDLRILVKRYEDGVLSRYITNRKPDQQLQLRKADPAYTLPKELPPQFLMIVGGTGVATAVQLAKYLQDKEDVRVDVLYSSRTPDEIYLKDELDKSADSITYLVDSEKRFVSVNDIKRVIKSDATQVLVCGPDGFVDHVAGVKPEVGQGQIGGLCGQLNLRNVWKL
ncbi:hypothetical protein PYCC9005_004453 [Savitreella phatthalungensis]